jgi:hypothetical protein
MKAKALLYLPDPFAETGISGVQARIRMLFGARF